MADYIVCPNKRNAPRMNILVCRERCPMKEDCSVYNAHIEIPLRRENLPLPMKVQKVSAFAS